MYTISLCPLTFSFPGYLIGDAATIPNSPGTNRLLGACEQDHSGALACPTGPQGLSGFQDSKFEGLVSLVVGIPYLLKM